MELAFSVLIRSRFDVGHSPQIEHLLNARHEWITIVEQFGRCGTNGRVFFQGTFGGDHIPVASVQEENGMIP